MSGPLARTGDISITAVLRTGSNRSEWPIVGNRRVSRKMVRLVAGEGIVRNTDTTNPRLSLVWWRECFQGQPECHAPSLGSLCARKKRSISLVASGPRGSV